MKKTSALLALFLTLIFALFLAGCTGSSPDGTLVDSSDSSDNSDTTAATDDGMLKLVSDGSALYTLVRGENASAAAIDAATSINKAINELTGIYLPITTDHRINPVSEYEILVGSTERIGNQVSLDISGLEADSFIIRVVEKRIIILGGSDYMTIKASEYFIENYLSPAGGDGSTLSISPDISADHQEDFSEHLKIMTQNLLATDTEYANVTTVDPSMHTLIKRMPRILSLITTYSPDSIGVQECSATWRSYFDVNLPRVGYSRIGADKNPKIGVIYKAAALSPIDSGSFWLTESPETLKISKEWNATTERLGMYVVFEVVATGERFVHFNTHFGFENTVFVENQAKVLLEYIKKITDKYNCPVTVTGDFNFNSTKPYHAQLTSGILKDTKDIAIDSVGAGSFNKFRSQDYASLPIDLVFVSEADWDVVKYRVIYDTYDGYFASDHYAVISEMKLLKK